MGRPRKAEIESPPPENEVQKPVLKTVEAKHTIVYNEPVRIPVSESEPDESDESELVEPEMEEDGERARPSRPLSMRARLREKLSRNGITDQEQLRLRIDRLPLYDANGQSGVNAEKEFIRTTTCTESFLTSDDYLEHIRATAGPGVYWLTLRHGKSIVASWQERIGGAPPSPNFVETIPADVLHSQPAQANDFSAVLRQAKQFAELKKIFAPEADNQPRTVVNGDALTTEQALLTLMNADNQVVDSVAGKLRSLLRGNGSAAEADRGWLDILYIAIERDTLPKLINQFATQFKPVASNAATGEAPAQPIPSAEPTMTPDVAAYQRLIEVLLHSMRANGDVTPVLQAADGFVVLFPHHGEMVQRFLDAPVEMLLPALAQTSPLAAEVTALPHAAEWIGKLKAAYFEEGEENQNETRAS